MVLVIPLAAFFGFIGLSLFLLCLTNKVASKYLNGDFLKAPETADELETERSDVENLEKSKSKDINRVQKGECDIEESMETGKSELRRNVEFKDSNDVFQPQIKTIGNKSLSFTGNAKVNLSLEYDNDRKILTGCILGIDDLSRDNVTSCPDLICYHIKLKPPSGKSKVKTVWKDLNYGSNLEYNFTLGPFKKDVLLRSNILFRLYGKKKRFGARLKCFGESLVSLRTVSKSKGPLVVTRRILPKSNAVDIENGSSSTDDDFSLDYRNYCYDSIDSIHVSEVTSVSSGVPQGSLVNLTHKIDPLDRGEEHIVKDRDNFNSDSANKPTSLTITGTDTVINVQDEEE